MIEYQNLLPFAATVSVVGGAWLTVRRIAKDAIRSKEKQAADILRAAKEEDSILKAKLEARIESVKAQLANLELNVNKDVTHLKETYSSEIKTLGEKIETLRDELHNQHVGVLNLLSKLIDKN